MVLCALAEVLFELESGHQVQGVFPPGIFSDAELHEIAMNSFPDSMSMELRSSSSVRDSSFCFRLRRASPPPGAPRHLQWVYAHVFCRQRQDERLRRGCEQKAIVLLSWLPLHSVLEPLARLVGPTVLSYGPNALRQVFEEVQQWPPLEWGSRMELPLLGVESIHVQLPLLTSMPSSALPAAVAAGLGQYAVAAALSQHGSAAPSLDPPGGSGSGSDDEPGTSGRQRPGRGGAGTAAVPAQSAGAAPADAEGARAAAAAAAAAGDVGGQAAAMPHLLVASPTQVAMALADELDGSGLPVGMLNQAYGQQEPEASVFGDCDCFTPLRAVLPQLWTLWELLLLGEPLMVVSPTPGGCSSTVAALLSLLAPFPFSLDWRPYFTIHDAAFARLAAGQLPTASNGLPVLMGVTNVYFLKALPDWPNVLATGHTSATVLPSSSNERLDELARAGNGSSGGEGSSGGMHASDSTSSVGSSGSGLGTAGGGGRPAGGAAALAGGAASRLGSMLRRKPASPAALLSGPVDHCWLAYKPLSKPDRTILDRLVQPQPSDPADKWRRVAAVNSTMLRRHFQELTKALLAPLLPFISPCRPPPLSEQHGADPKAARHEPPPLPRLDVDTLLARLSGKDTRLPDVLVQRFGGQRGVVQFYHRFLRSPNLVAFMHLRRVAAAEWQRQEWEAAAAAAPVQELLSVETFFHLEQRLAAARQQLASAGGGDRGGGGAAHGEAAELAAQLQQQLHLAFSDLPEDLQEAIRSTPLHAALLQQHAGAAQQPQPA